MSGSPLLVLPREFGQVPPPMDLVGGKARQLAQVLAQKARVPRFGVLTTAAFDLHCQQDALFVPMQAAFGSPLKEEAQRQAAGDALSRAVLQAPLPEPVRDALRELIAAFNADDQYAVRGSVVGDRHEQRAMKGLVDGSLFLPDLPALETAVRRAYASAFDPRALRARHKAGLPPLGSRVALVVQRMVNSEVSGECLSLDPKNPPGLSPTVSIRATWGLGGGEEVTHGASSFAEDTFSVWRPVAADEGIDDAAEVQDEPALKPDALRFHDEAGKGTKVVAVPEAQAKQPSLTAMQCRAVAREGLRLEAAFGRPQRIRFAFAGRLLHVLHAEPLLQPNRRVESNRIRTWDQRLVPEGLVKPTTPLSASAWQGAAARAVDDAARLLAVDDATLLRRRGLLSRVVGILGGRLYAGMDAVDEVLQMLPEPERLRSAVAAAAGIPELSRRWPKPIGVMERLRRSQQEARWPARLARVAKAATTTKAEVEAACRAFLGSHAIVGEQDPDLLLERFEEQTALLGRALCAAAVVALADALYRQELDDLAVELSLVEPKGLVSDLLAGDPDPRLFDLTKRVHSIAAHVRDRRALAQVFAQESSADALLARIEEMPAAKDVVEEIAAVVASRPATGVLALEAPRLHERKEQLLQMVLRVLPLEPPDFDKLLRAARGLRDKAEYLFEARLGAQGGLRATQLRRRFRAAVDGARRSAGEHAACWLLLDELALSTRETCIALGDRLFEHGLLDQPQDVFYLTSIEVKGLLRGTIYDKEARPLVAARKRQASHLPVVLPRRIETEGVVAASPLPAGTNENPTSIVSILEAKGRPASSGEVVEKVAYLAENPAADVAGLGLTGVVVAVGPSPELLPCLLGARAVIFERGSPSSPVVQALRAVGMPCIVDVAKAGEIFPAGERVHVDARAGTVKRVEKMPEQLRPNVVELDAEAFAATAMPTDPSLRAMKQGDVSSDPIANVVDDDRD